MLLSDFSAIRNKLLHIRKHAGLTQAEVAEAAGLSDRTYADIERGTANMRVATLLSICRALQITPNDVLASPDGIQVAPSDDLFAAATNSKMFISISSCLLTKYCCLCAVLGILLRVANLFFAIQKAAYNHCEIYGEFVIIGMILLQ